jgi:hypothetical protein
MTRLTKLLILIALTVSLAPAIRAQAADETMEWITNFIATNGGDDNGHFVASWGITDNGHRALYFSDVKTVERWERGRISFVRIAGAVHDCTGYAGGVSFTVCGSSPGYFDIELHSNDDVDTTNRLVKAFTHMAELAGAKPNAKQPF